MIAKRVLGITDARIAQRREENFYAQVLNMSHRPGYDKYKARMKNHLFNYHKSLNVGNQKAADGHLKKYEKLLRLETCLVESTLVFKCLMILN